MEDKFWMLFVEGKAMPTVFHWNDVVAKVEAERLARKEGKRVYLLESVSYCEVEIPEPPIKWEVT